ncbi:ATPase SWSAP1 [Triplophysa dalaica]|uniref:ATPase SWSAP1 n=1 Tax=Triplophysa dalaica TaxID=1582913 RepID=UPI0024E024AE|nr:ATPase SWSAP1 [Triplophysa dalaica]
MADILEVVFRRFASGPLTRDVRFPPDVESNTVVHGDRDSSRCLLFLAAVTAATDLGLKVVFFTQTPFESLQVSLRGSIPGLKLEALKNVKFVYAKTLEEFLEDVASLHELDSPPSLIIVDDLERYLHRPIGGPLQDDLSPVAHVAALLHDTAAFLTQILHGRGENKGSCRFIVSFYPECDGGETQAADLLLSVLERYLQVRCTLEEARGGGVTGQREWRVYLSATRPLQDQWCVQARQWCLVVRPSGAVEFRPVIDVEQEIPEEQKISREDVETDNKHLN